MKNVIPYFLSSILGGLVVFALIDLKDPTTTNPNSLEKNQAVLTNHVNSPSPYPFDFVGAAGISKPAVVHIKAEESQETAQKRYQQDGRSNRRSPFGQFFGLEDFFDMDAFQTPFHRQKGSGSGVIISNDGYIVTNNHVVGFADNIIVTTDDGKQYQARKIGTDPSSDVAVIKVDETNLPYIKFGDSEKVLVGEWVLAVGNPFDYLTSTVTAGIVSAKGRDLDIIKGQKTIEEFIQTDAAINPGNSGGALVNLRGEIIGLNTAIATPTGVYAGYSFAIPSNLVKRIVNEIKENGNIERANLGIYVRDVNDMLSEGESVDSDYGVYVDEVDNGSSAQFAGILPNDIIIGINGKKITGFDEMKNALKFVKVGDSVDVRVIRNGISKKISVKLKRGI